MSSLALISWAEQLETQILQLGESEPHKAFLISHKLGKISDTLKKQFQPKAIEFWMENKELPWGYSCKETNRSSYEYSENEEWRQTKARLEFLEEQIKKATDSGVEFPNPETGLYIKPVTKNSSAIYSFSHK